MPALPGQGLFQRQSASTKPAMAGKQPHTLDVRLGEDIILTYATPVMLHRVPNAGPLNEGLKRVLLARERAARTQAGGGVSISNVGGWQSKSDLLTWPEPEIAALKEVFTQAVGRMMQLAARHDPRKMVEAQFVMDAWANVNRSGDYNAAHSHPGCHWSGVYYVSTGEMDPAQPQNGMLEFYDPRGATAAFVTPGFTFGVTHAVNPEPGMIVLFPSWHLHAVRAYHGTSERISIAFNARITNSKMVDRPQG